MFKLEKINQTVSWVSMSKALCEEILSATEANLTLLEMYKMSYTSKKRWKNNKLLPIKN